MFEDVIKKKHWGFRGNVPKCLGNKATSQAVLGYSWQKYAGTFATLASNVYNGLHYYRVCISKPKPSFLHFGKYQIFIKYNSQILTC